MKADSKEIVSLINDLLGTHEVPREMKLSISSLNDGDVLQALEIIGGMQTKREKNERIRRAVAAAKRLGRLAALDIDIGRKAVDALKLAAGDTKKPGGHVLADEEYAVRNAADLALSSYYAYLSRSRILTGMQIGSLKKRIDPNRSRSFPTILLCPKQNRVLRTQ